MDILFLEVNPHESLKVDNNALNIFQDVYEKMSAVWKVARSEVGDTIELQIGEFTTYSKDLTIHLPKKPSESVFEKIVRGNGDYYGLSGGEEYEYRRVAIGSIDGNYQLLYDFLSQLYESGFEGKVSIDGNMVNEITKENIGEMDNIDKFIKRMF